MKKMDYSIGFQGGRPGPTWTATALTDRAKVRTLEPVTFEDRSAALKFLKDSQAEGYRFAGASSIDPEERMVKNRYFVIGANGELVFSGEDNGPRDTVWEVGDVMPGATRIREWGVSSKTSFRGLVYENVLVAILPSFSVFTRSGAELSRHRRFPHLIPRNLVRAAFTESRTVRAVGTKASTPLETRCCKERLQS